VNGRLQPWRIAFVTLTAVLIAGCSGEPALEIAAGIDACDECGMIIDRTAQSAGYVVDGALVPFDSPLCALRSIAARRARGEAPPTAIYFADYRDSSLQPAEATAFLLTDHVPTVMESGVLCFASREAAESARRHESDRVTDWNGFRLARDEPDRVLEVRFGPDGMVPDVVEAAKGDLLLWRARSDGLDREIKVSIKGFPDVGEIGIPASGEEVELRMWADRPGAGFPVVAAGIERPLGALKVSGSHTADEEAR